MAGYLSFWPEGPQFEWQDKSGSRADGKTRLPFFVWVPSPKITDTSNIPTIAIQTNKVRLVDAFRIMDASVVSARFKAIIEEFEPDVHQFFPVELRRKDGTPYEDSYFIFHPTRMAPCVLLSKSKISEIVRVKVGPRTGLLGCQTIMCVRTNMSSVVQPSANGRSLVHYSWGAATPFSLAMP